MPPPKNYLPPPTSSAPRCCVAHAALATGSVLLARGDAPAALVALRRAAGDWREMGAPYEGARTRLLIADACEALGDLDGAEMERRAAGSTFAALGGEPLRRA